MCRTPKLQQFRTLSENLWPIDDQNKVLTLDQTTVLSKFSVFIFFPVVDSTIQDDSAQLGWIDRGSDINVFSVGRRADNGRKLCSNLCAGRIACEDEFT
jgi:hypothetical protein